MTPPTSGGPAWTPPGAPAPRPDGQDHPDWRPQWLRAPGGTPPSRGYGWSPTPPPPERPPGRRVGGLAAAIILVLVVGLAGSGLLVATRRDQPAPPAAAGGSGAAAPSTAAPTARARSAGSSAATASPAAVRAVQREVAELRGLRFRRDVPITIESPVKLSRRLLRVMAEETDRAELTRQGRALELLGELPPGTDLAGALSRIQSESVLGFYLPGRPPKGSLYVRSAQGLDPFARSVLAHELTHAVTDQNYDLTRADRLEAASGREDELVAYSGLVEGDASLTAQLYVVQRFTAAEKASFAMTAARQRTPGPDAAPAAVRERLVFPYQAGLRFVAVLFQQGGWAAVNRAYRDPPTSTEQLLHPERYLRDRDQPQPVTVPDLSGRLGAGWRPGAELGFGEFDARLLLQGELPVTAAEAAAAGWDGGRLRTFQRGRDTALALRSVWDSDAEAARFCGAMTRWSTARFGSATRSGPGTLRWSDPAQHTALICRAARVAWLSAPTRPTLDRLVTGLATP